MPACLNKLLRIVTSSQAVGYCRERISPADVRQVAGALHVGYVLEARFSDQGGGVRITAQLIDPQSGRAAVVAAARQSQISEFANIGRQIKEIIEAVKAGMRSPSMTAELERLEGSKARLKTETTEIAKTPPSLHPRLAGVYRQKVEDLSGALNDNSTRADAAEVLRTLIGEIRLAPKESKLDIELVGRPRRAMAGKSPGTTDAGAQLTLVAGTRNHRDSLVAIPI